MGARFSKPATWALCAGLVLVGACSTIRSTIDVTSELRDRGYDDPNVSVTSDNVVEVTYRSTALRSDSESIAADELEVAEVVWERMDVRVDGVYVEEERSDKSQYLPRSALVDRFGERDPALDDTTFADDAARAGRIAIGVVIVMGLVFLAVVALVIWLVVRSQRKRRAKGGPTAGPGFSGDPRLGTPGAPVGWTPDANPPLPQMGEGWQPPPRR